MDVGWVYCRLFMFIFFFKQKTAYEMRISDWSSDVCSSDLVMLVLLIIFLIAVPVVIQSVPVKLPDVRFDPTTTKPENVSLSIKAGPTGDCEVYWNMTKVTSQELLDRAVEKLKLEIARQGGVNAPDLELPEAHKIGRANVCTPV